MTRSGGRAHEIADAEGQKARPMMTHPSWLHTRLSVHSMALAAFVVGCGAPNPRVPANTSAELPSNEAPVAPPGVRAKLIGQEGATRTYQLVLAPGTEAIAAISDFVVQNHIQAAHFHGLGACADAVLAYYDPLTHTYQKTAYKQQMEIVSIIGDAAPTPGDGAGIHAHMGVAFADGTMRGGHLFEAHVSPTLELELTASPVAVHRALDETFKGWLLVP
jgi:predicted DNA-binding protein with PD1-like motif